MNKSWKEYAKNIWHFIWHDDSLASWIVNILLAFVLIKFIVYPGLGLIFGTNFPVVAVVSSSMEHVPSDYEKWWGEKGSFYKGEITKESFAEFPFEDGFNKGDIMVVFGIKPEKIKTGMILVFWSKRADPIIHRVIEVKKEQNKYVFQTKGDNNIGQIQTDWLDETIVPEKQVIGRAVLRVPLLGWVKIGFVKVLQYAGIVHYGI